MSKSTMSKSRWVSKGIWASSFVFALMLSGCDNDTEGAAEQQGQVLQAPAEGQSQQGEVVDAENGQAAADPVMTKRSENALQATAVMVEGKAIPVVTNPEAVTVIVNKQRSLPDGYEPTDLVVPNIPFSFDGEHEKKYMRKEAAEALEELFAAAAEQGIELRGVSGYRSYTRQKAIYDNNVKTRGEEVASRVSAPPGTSEHQTGLTIDVSSPSAGNALEESFGATVEGKWLAEHGPEFGFIIRYPQNGESLTGYVYEPWHIRYIGKDLAPDIAASGMTLEEYFDEANIKL